MTSTATKLAVVQAHMIAVERALGAELASATLGQAADLVALLAAAQNDLNVSLDSMMAAVKRREVELHAIHTELTLQAAVELIKSGALSIDAIAERAGVAVAPSVAPVLAVRQEPAVATPAAQAPSVLAPVASAVLSADKVAAAAGYKYEPKFMDPATGRVWSGMGPRPKWLKALLVDGKTLADFAVKPTSADAAPVAVAAVGAPPEAAADVASFSAGVDATPVVSPKTKQSEHASEGASSPTVAQPDSTEVSPKVQADAAADDDIGAPVTFDGTDFKTDDLDAASPSASDDDLGDMMSDFDSPLAGYVTRTDVSGGSQFMAR